MAENPQIPTTSENPQIPTEIIKIPLFEQERSEYLEVFRDAMRYALDTDVFGLWNPDSYLHTGQRFYDIQCACVEPFNMGGVLSHPAYTGLIEKLYEKRHDRDKCPICLAKDCIDTITHCGHAYCFRCVAPWLNEKNICPECRQPCSIETIAMLSSKMTYVFNSVDQLVQTKEKIVVFAQNLGVIALLQHALLGHKRADSMFIWEWNSNDIQEFLNSPYKILLMPLNALQGPMLLPSNSTVIFLEACTKDLRNFVFNEVSTTPGGTLSSQVLVADKTVEEEILDAQQLSSIFGESENLFLGPTFTNRLQIKSMLLLSASKGHT
jgi:hypothetical protein